MTKIPKIIHYMWLGDKPKSEETLKYIESWKKNNPDFEIIEWNESNLDLECCDFVKDALKHKKWAFVSDYVRLYCLNKMGGIWLDTDVKIIKPFDESMMNLDGFMSFENSAYLQTAVIGSKKNNELIKELLNFYSNRSFIKKGKPDLTPNTILITAILNKYYGLKYKNDFQVIDNLLTIFPNEYLAPKDYTTGKITITDKTMTVHNFASSWLDSSKSSKFLYGVRKVFGKKIFDFFTICYMKVIDGKCVKEYKSIMKK